MEDQDRVRRPRPAPAQLRRPPSISAAAQRFRPHSAADQSHYFHGKKIRTWGAASEATATATGRGGDESGAIQSPTATHEPIYLSTVPPPICTVPQVSPTCRKSIHPSKVMAGGRR
jgi:hypothetical protein